VIHADRECKELSFECSTWRLLRIIEEDSALELQQLEQEEVCVSCRLESVRWVFFQNVEHLYGFEWLKAIEGIVILYLRYMYGSQE